MPHLLHLDMIQTAGVAALALLLGMYMTKRIKLLRNFCVPSPVSGGLAFSLLALALYSIAGVEIKFDVTLKEFFMLAFFTCVGFQSDMKVIRTGGRPLLVMVLLLAVIMTLQNILPLSLAQLLDVDPLVGMAAGSVSMAGGHGTSAGFSGLFEQMGLQGAETIALAAATFGLVSGSVLGGPLADFIIRRKLKLSGDEVDVMELNSVPSLGKPNPQKVEIAVCWIVIVMAGGSLVSKLLAMTGLSFPTYFGSLILAALVRNAISGFSSTRIGSALERSLDMNSMMSVSRICLALFLGMAMISLKLWELSSLALPLLVMLLCQVLMLALICYFIAFPMLGKDYDAAVLVAGICGFGLGATPNAMANMNAICTKYHYSVKPFLIIPIIGAIFVDLMNTGIIIGFLEMLK